MLLLMLRPAIAAVERISGLALAAVECISRPAIAAVECVNGWQWVAIATAELLDRLAVGAVEFIHGLANAAVKVAVMFLPALAAVFTRNITYEDPLNRILSLPASQSWMGRLPACLS